VVGKGSTFHVYLPVKSAEKPADVLPSVPAAAPAAPSGLRILVMDDEEAIRESLCLALRQMGHEVVAVSEGGAAVKFYEEAGNAGRPFDLVILDLTVTDGMGGRDALDGIREFDPDAVAVVMSGYSQDKTVQ